MIQMKKKFLAEIIFSLLILVILFLYAYLEPLTMPMGINSMLLGFLLISYLFFVSFAWKEKSLDERESVHAGNAGRISFLVGSSVLTIGFITQSLKHAIDPWIVYSLALMVLTKIISRIYLQIKN